MGGADGAGLIACSAPLPSDRRLTRNMEVQRETLSCFTHLTTCFQWLHEEALNQPSAGHPWVGPQRSSTLIPLKKVGGPRNPHVHHGSRQCGTNHDIGCNQTGAYFCVQITMLDCHCAGRPFWRIPILISSTGLYSIHCIHPLPFPPPSLLFLLPLPPLSLPLSCPLPPLAQASSEQQIINSVNSVKEKMQSQHFRISQRLQWAAGANPSLNVTLDDFERAVSKRSVALQVNPTPTVCYVCVLCVCVCTRVLCVCACVCCVCVCVRMHVCASKRPETE